MRNFFVSSAPSSTTNNDTTTNAQSHPSHTIQGAPTFQQPQPPHQFALPFGLPAPSPPAIRMDPATLGGATRNSPEEETKGADDSTRFNPSSPTNAAGSPPALLPPTSSSERTASRASTSGSEPPSLSGSPTQQGNIPTINIPIISQSEPTASLAPPPATLDPLSLHPGDSGGLASLLSPNTASFLGLTTLGHPQPTSEADGQKQFENGVTLTVPSTNQTTPGDTMSAAFAVKEETDGNASKKVKTEGVEELPKMTIGGPAGMGIGDGTSTVIASNPFGADAFGLMGIGGLDNSGFMTGIYPGLDDNITGEKNAAVEYIMGSFLDSINALTPPASAVSNSMFQTPNPPTSNNTSPALDPNQPPKYSDDMLLIDFPTFANTSPSITSAPPISSTREMSLQLATAMGGIHARSAGNTPTSGVPPSMLGQERMLHRSLHSHAPHVSSPLSASGTVNNIAETVLNGQAQQQQQQQGQQQTQQGQQQQQQQERQPLVPSSSQSAFSSLTSMPSPRTIMSFFPPLDLNATGGAANGAANPSGDVMAAASALEAFGYVQQQQPPQPNPSVSQGQGPSTNTSNTTTTTTQISRRASMISVVPPFAPGPPDIGNPAMRRHSMFVPGPHAMGGMVLPPGARFPLQPGMGPPPMNGMPPRPPPPGMQGAPGMGMHHPPPPNGMIAIRPPPGSVTNSPMMFNGGPPPMMPRHHLPPGLNPPPPPNNVGPTGTVTPGGKAKPFRCEKCPQTFSRSHDLKRHYYIHSQEKPYPCPRCGKGFARRDALRRHEKAVADGKKVHCHASSPSPVLGTPKMGAGLMSTSSSNSSLPSSSSSSPLMPNGSSSFLMFGGTGDEEDEDEAMGGGEDDDMEVTT
ncbi:hypothetical protein HDU97_001112 [Phlyctochytrium planicorne]|nr:hypothetical protein HDU97_001112 [Phlyctochytrium planicorne]